MFKRIINDKKHEGQGDPVSGEEIREALKELFPQVGEINKNLSFEANGEIHDGFAAVWEYYMIDSDEDNKRREYLMKYTVNVDIRSEEKAVYLKTKRFTRTMRPPIDAEVLDPWFAGVGIGDITAIEGDISKSSKVFRTKRKLELLVKKATSLGWDVYM